MICFLGGCKQANYHKISEADFIEHVIEKTLPDPSTVIIFDEFSNRISLDSLKKLELSGGYFEDFYANSDGIIKKVIIRPKNKNDLHIIAQITNRLNEGAEIVLLDLSCSQLRTLLKKAAYEDQNARKAQSDNTEEVDKSNLRILVSFLENCRPTNQVEVTKEEWSNMWIILQHAPYKYQKKYYHQMKDATDHNLLSKGKLALLNDRILMREGKPQMYGTQISDDTLYLLHEPQYVNKRRSTVTLGPIEEYLERFGIKFTIVQEN